MYPIFELPTCCYYINHLSYRYVKFYSGNFIHNHSTLTLNYLPLGSVEIMKSHEEETKTKK